MKDVSEYEALYDVDKKNEGDVIYWTAEIDKLDSHLFSFDKKTVYNLFEDYPKRLTKEQKAIFDRENPFWVKFFGT